MAKKRTTPPFRADHVGSLLRPKNLADARQKWRDGKLDAAELTAVEDKAVRDAIALQESVGLKAITDGEFRRDYWHLDFLRGFEGMAITKEVYGTRFSGGEAVDAPKVVGKIGDHDSSLRDHFKFLKANTKQTAKYCIPGPAMAYMRGGSESIDKAAYTDFDEFLDDIATAYQREIQAYYDLGCRYIQIDDTSITYLCDETYRKRAVERGDDPEELLIKNCKTLTAAVSKRPADMVATVHMCRGNFKSTWMMAGGYDPVAETMFDNLDVDGFFMEYDSDRAGGFDPLAHANEGQIVVLGLITSKSPELESKDAIKRQIDEAAKLVPLEQLCLSPQCGFASTHHGNALTEDQEKRKLELVVEIANEVWGDA